MFLAGALGPRRKSLAARRSTQRPTILGVRVTNYVEPTLANTPHLRLGEFRMNPIVRAMWTDELESGRFKQTRNRLVGCGGNFGRERRYCCLGVLSELAARAGVVAYDPVLSDYVTTLPNGDEHRDSAMLPEVVARWAGLWTTDPQVRVYDHDDDDDQTGWRPLSACNDNYGYNFRKIAQLIKDSL